MSVLTLPQWTGVSVLGSRDHQEDAWQASHIGEGLWAAVADGIGGARAGDVAAHTAVSTLQRFITAQWPPPYDPTACADWLETGTLAVHHAVHRLARPGDGPQAPGTTLLWMVFLPAGHVVGCHVGDSRAYLLRHGVIWPLTTDMTPAGARVRQGQAPWSEQNTAADSHLLLSALGTDPLTLDVFDLPWHAHDTLILTTDGCNAVPLEQWSHLTPDRLPAFMLTMPWTDNATCVWIA